MKFIKLSILFILFIASIGAFAASNNTVNINGTTVVMKEIGGVRGTPSFQGWQGDYNGKPITLRGELGSMEVTYNGKTKLISDLTEENGDSKITSAINELGGENKSTVGGSAGQNSPSSGEKYCSDNLLGICSDYLRKGDININDIPLMIVSIIQFLMGIAASVAVVALIYHAVRMQLASGITGDSSGVDKAKGGMKGAALGFVLAMSAWFLLTKLIEILSTNT